MLSDFGIARSVDGISGLTTTNMTVGTVAYAAPEQLMGEDIDGRADQYALAATAYHLLRDPSSSRTPIPRSSSAAISTRQRLPSPAMSGEMSEGSGPGRGRPSAGVKAAMTVPTFAILAAALVVVVEFAI